MESQSDQATQKPNDILNVQENREAEITPVNPDSTTNKDSDDKGAKEENKDPKIRETFVQLLFSLTVAEIAREVSEVINRADELFKLVNNNHLTIGSFSHLLVGAILVTASWVGWKNSNAPMKKVDVTSIFSPQYIVLLIDVVLVSLYFILVRASEISAFNKSVNSSFLPSASIEMLLILIIFIIYLIWDIFLYFDVSSSDAKNHKLESKKATTSSKLVDRWKQWLGDYKWSTPLCVFLSGLAYLLFHKTSAIDSVVWSDTYLIALLLFFRSIQEKNKLGTFVIFIVLIISSIANLYDWPFPFLDLF